MWNKLKPREKRILKLVLAMAVLIFGYLLIEPLLKDYQQVKAERLQLRETLDDFLRIRDGNAARQKTIAQRVPVFEMPADAEPQSKLFRDEITKQLQQCGLKAKSMKLRQNKAKKVDGYKVWIVECHGQGRYSSIMRFVAGLKKNPYFVAIEKLVLKVDSKDRNKMTYHLIVSTYAK